MSLLRYELRRLYTIWALLMAGSGPVKAIKYHLVVVKDADRTQAEWNNSNPDFKPASWYEACAFCAWDWCREAHENGDL